jgi:hypothetical protein
VIHEVSQVDNSRAWVNGYDGQRADGVWMRPAGEPVVVEDVAGGGANATASMATPTRSPAARLVADPGGRRQPVTANQQRNRDVPRGQR